MHRNMLFGQMIDPALGGVCVASGQHPRGENIHSLCRWRQSVCAGLDWSVAAELPNGTHMYRRSLYPCDVREMISFVAPFNGFMLVNNKIEMINGMNNE